MYRTSSIVTSIYDEMNIKSGVWEEENIRLVQVALLLNFVVIKKGLELYRSIITITWMPVGCILYCVKVIISFTITRGISQIDIGSISWIRDNKKR